MSFPRSITGQFDVSRQTCSGDVRDEAAAAAAYVLKAAYYDVESEYRSLSAWPSFDGWVMMNAWHPMIYLSKTYLVVDGQPDCATVRYRISTQILLNYTSVVAVGAGIFACVTPWINRQEHFLGIVKHLATGLFVAGVAWFWLFGMNYLVASWRAPAWLRRRIEEQVGASAN